MTNAPRTTTTTRPLDCQACGRRRATTTFQDRGVCARCLPDVTTRAAKAAGLRAAKAAKTADRSLGLDARQAFREAAEEVLFTSEAFEAETSADLSDLANSWAAVLVPTSW